MNNFMKMVSIFIISIFYIIGCTEVEVPETNYFSIDGGAKFSLSQAAQFGDPATDSYQLFIGSDGFDLTDISNSGILGTGHFVAFIMTSTSTTRLESGIYTYNTDGSANTYGFSFIATFSDIGGGDAIEKYENTARGEVTVELKDTTYTIDFDLTLDGGKKLIGNYTGKIQEIEG